MLIFFNENNLAVWDFVCNFAKKIMDKYKNKYRIPTNRLLNYDYGTSGCYHITICTKNRICYFGEICDGQMQLSEIGKIAKTEWLKTTELRCDMNLWLDEFVVMPNHFHGIIGIGNNPYNAPRRDAMHCVSTIPTHCVPIIPPHCASKIPSSTILQPYKNNFGPQSKNLASIIRGFKIAVTTYAKKHNIDFAWQERFHDSIIHDNNGLNCVREYIINNPQKWNNDSLNCPKTT